MVLCQGDYGGTPTKILIVGKADRSYAVSAELWDQWAFHKLGHHCEIANILNRSTDTLIKEILAKGRDFDLVLYAYSKGVRADVISATKQVAKVSAVSTYDHLLWNGCNRITGYLECSRLVDLSFHTGGAIGCPKAILAPQGCEPLDGLNDPPHPHTGRPAFIGGAGKDRGDFLARLRACGCDIIGSSKKTEIRRQDLYNECGRRSLLIGHIRRAQAGPEVWDPMAPMYRSDRLNVLAGFGACVLHPWHPGIDDEYIDGKEIVLFKTYDEMVAKIRMLAENSDLCRQIGASALARAQRDHTYLHRARIILDAM